MDLERELRALPIEWPATPQFEPVLARRRRRWPLAVAIALAAIAAAFAVPQSRGAILRFFDIGADKIEFVGTLPPAQERSLDAGLGAPIDARHARGIRLAAPAAAARPAADAAPSGDVVSLVFDYRGPARAPERGARRAASSSRSSSAARPAPSSIRSGASLRPLARRQAARLLLPPRAGPAGRKHPGLAGKRHDVPARGAGSHETGSA